MKYDIIIIGADPGGIFPACEPDKTAPAIYGSTKTGKKGPAE